MTIRRFIVAFAVLVVWSVGAPAAAQMTYDGMSKKDYFYTTYVKMGNRDFDQGNYEAALASYQKATEYKVNGQVFALIGETYGKLRQFQNALGAYQRAAVMLNPRTDGDMYVVAHYMIGSCYDSLDKPQEELKAFEVVARMTPSTDRQATLISNAKKLVDNLKKQLALADAIQGYDEAHKNVEALEGHRSAPPNASRTQPNVGATAASSAADVASLISRADSALTGGRYDEAAAGYQQAIRLQPENPQPYFGLGQAQHQLQRWNEAVASFGKLIEYAPGFAAGHYWRASATFMSLPHAAAESRASLLARVVEDLGKALALDPKMANALHMRAWANLVAGKGDAAFGDAKSYVALAGWKAPAAYVAMVGFLGAAMSGQSSDGASLLRTCLSNCGAEWPRPAVSHLNWDVTDAELFKQATDNDKQTEARTYHGMQLLRDGLIDAAKVQFQWVAEHGNQRFFEYVLATEALRRPEAFIKQAPSR